MSRQGARSHAAAQSFKTKLEAILEGEPPHDIYVCWKRKHEQPIGWDSGVKMPDAERAFVEEAKLGYLLRAEEKGGFFEALGFSEEEAEILKEALLDHARRSDVSRTVETAFGVKYVIEGSLQSPDGRNPEVRSVWIEEFGSDRIRVKGGGCDPRIREGRAHPRLAGGEPRGR